MSTQPVLGAVTLPWPSEYSEPYGYRGASVEMANGTLAFDLVNPNSKRNFSLTWTHLTDAQRATVHTAFDTTKTASVTFVAPTGSSYTVTRAANQNELKWSLREAAGGVFRWSTSMKLREV